MRKLATALIACAALACLGGCAMPQSAPVYGGLVTNNVKGPVAGVDNSVNPTKQGVAEARAILFFATGDASIQAAMADGGITKVHHVDSETFSVLGVYASHKTIVYGE